MIVDMRAQPLIDRLLAANEAEGVAIKALHDYLQGGGRDNEKAEALLSGMTRAHDKKMDIWSQLEAVRLDK